MVDADSVDQLEYPVGITGKVADTDTARPGADQSASCGDVAGDFGRNETGMREPYAVDMRVREHDRLVGDLQHAPDCGFRHVSEVDQHAEPVHFAHDSLAGRRQGAVMACCGHGLADLVGAVMHQGD